MIVAMISPGNVSPSLAPEAHPDRIGLLCPRRSIEIEPEAGHALIVLVARVDDARVLADQLVGRIAEDARDRRVDEEDAAGSGRR